MIKEFQEYISSNKLCENQDRILLGVSGGADSVCMFHLFREAGIPFGVAHCNFQLRAEESEEDEKFVQNLANTYDIPFFNVKFNTQEVADEQGISIQMAARDLRYDWFEEIRQKYDYNYIAIAHNSDDVIETFLVNLSRGTGIRGLSGIKNKTNNIIRPILFASRKDITEFLNQNEYSFREDSSNQSTKYSRNLIRHEVIPLFEQINPRFRETIIENIQKLKDIEKIYTDKITQLKDEFLVEENETIRINIEELKELNPISTYAYELLNPFGFSFSQIQDIIESLDGISGKQFYSLTHRLIKDRSYLIINEKSKITANTYYLEANNDSIEKPLNLNFSIVDNSEEYIIETSSKIGQFDFDRLEFPLVLRKWEKGDYFMPLGMDNLKKLSDFFIDEKLSITEKENTWIIESNGKIVWLVGHRPDNRFKINPNTKKIFKITFS